MGRAVQKMASDFIIIPINGNCRTGGRSARYARQPGCLQATGLILVGMCAVSLGDIMRAEGQATASTLW